MLLCCFSACQESAGTLGYQRLSRWASDKSWALEQTRSLWMLRVLLEHKGSSNPHSIMENHVNLETIAKTRARVVCCVRTAHGCVLGWACCVTCFLRYSVCCLPQPVRLRAFSWSSVWVCWSAEGGCSALLGFPALHLAGGTASRWWHCCKQTHNETIMGEKSGFKGENHFLLLMSSHLKLPSLPGSSYMHIIKSLKSRCRNTA